MTEKVLITRSQLATELKITLDWVDKSRKSGRLPNYEPGTKLFDRAKALAHWESWQKEVNQEDAGSTEYLESVLRLTRSRVELSRQKLAKLLRALILATDAEQVWTTHRQTILSEFSRLAITASESLSMSTDRAAICSALTELVYTAIDRINAASGSDDLETPEYVHRGSLQDVTLEIKDRIEKARTELNHIEAEIRETKARVVSGDLLVLAKVEEVLAQRVNSTRMKLLGLPNHAIMALTGRDSSAIHHSLTERLEHVASTLDPWRLDDFLEKDVIRQFKADLEDGAKEPE